jgi:hypothetical protein
VVIARLPFLGQSTTTKRLARLGLIFVLLPAPAGSRAVFVGFISNLRRRSFEHQWNSHNWYLEFSADGTGTVENVTQGALANLWISTLWPSVETGEICSQ